MTVNSKKLKPFENGPEFSVTPEPAVDEVLPGWLVLTIALGSAIIAAGI